jgi:toxin FitB
MLLLDSNIIIYASQPEHEQLRKLISEEATCVSAISKVETLGYHRLSEIERRLLEAFFAEAFLLAVSEPIVDQAVALRQQRRVTLGDALIASTAIVHTLPLITHNSDDFAGIDGLEVIDPLSTS